MKKINTDNLEIWKLYEMVREKNSSWNTRSAMVDYILWGLFLLPDTQPFSPKAPVSLHCGYLFTWPINIGFWLLRDKNEILLTSTSPVPSTVFRKQWMFYEGLLMGRRRESVSERRIERAYWERKLESSTLTKRNTMSLCAIGKVILCSRNVMFSLQLIGKVPRITHGIGVGGEDREQDGGTGWDSSQMGNFREVFFTQIVSDRL